ncbi:transposase, partial [Mangrovicoccus sp. HB161399]|uniref:transposase n=1 Tax=Mangrovicoccus sp. HB161399 TaxID=2720392 RepID=UPI00352BDC40
MDRPDQVWCADITVRHLSRTDGVRCLTPHAARVPVSCGDHGLGNSPGSVLAAVELDGRRSSLRLIPRINRLTLELCIEALEDAMRLHGRPGIFHTDQGSQFTSPRFTDVLLDAKVQISMDGRGRWMDNVMIERLWRSLKYECVYLNAFETGSEARTGIGRWIVRHLSRTDRVRRLTLQH